MATARFLCVAAVVAAAIVAPAHVAAACTDVPPDRVFTCEQQLVFGKCSADFMLFPAPGGGTFCDATCGRCGGKVELFPAERLPVPEPFARSVTVTVVRTTFVSVFSGYGVTVATFTSEVRYSYRLSVAKKAGVPVEFVQITDVTDVRAARRHRALLQASEGVHVETKVFFPEDQYETGAAQAYAEDFAAAVVDDPASLFEDDPVLSFISVDVPEDSVEQETIEVPVPVDESYAPSPAMMPSEELIGATIQDLADQGYLVDDASPAPAPAAAEPAPETTVAAEASAPAPEKPMAALDTLDVAEAPAPAPVELESDELLDTFTLPRPPVAAPAPAPMPVLTPQSLGGLMQERPARAPTDTEGGAVNATTSNVTGIGSS